jgi:hypothetical protein
MGDTKQNLLKCMQDITKYHIGDKTMNNTVPLKCPYKSQWEVTRSGIYARQNFQLKKNLG